MHVDEVTITAHAAQVRESIQLPRKQPNIPYADRVTKKAAREEKENAFGKALDDEWTRQEDAAEKLAMEYRVSLSITKHRVHQLSNLKDKRKPSAWNAFIHYKSREINKI